MFRDLAVATLAGTVGGLIAAAILGCLGIGGGQNKRAGCCERPWN